MRGFRRVARQHGGDMLTIFTMRHGADSSRGSQRRRVTRRHHLNSKVVTCVNAQAFYRGRVPTSFVPRTLPPTFAPCQRSGRLTKMSVTGGDPMSPRRRGRNGGRPNTRIGWPSMTRVRRVHHLTTSKE